MALIVNKVIAFGSLFVIVAAALDLSQHYHQEIQEFKKPIVPITKQSFDQHKDGYQYSYETGNGIQAQETGFIKNRGDKKHETLIQQGSFSYHDEHGRPITLSYIADEHGFQPQGAHLPTPPPVPQEHKKSVQQQQEFGAHSGFEQHPELGGHFSFQQQPEHTGFQQTAHQQSPHLVHHFQNLEHHNY